MSKLRWGIVSTGRMAGWFCDDFGEVTNGVLSAVCSRSATSADKFAKKYGIPHRFDTIDDLLGSDAIDVVYVATPHTTHKEIILKCLDRSLPILCEKPFVTSVEDAKQVIDASQRSGTYFMEAMWTWHLPAIKAAKQWVDSGRIGKLVHIKADFGYPVAYAPDQREYDANDAGGALREMGIYPVALMRLFTDHTVQNLHVTHQRAPNGVENDVTAVFDFDDHTATLTTSYRCRLGNSAHIVGEDGYILIPDFFRADRADLYHLDDLVETAAFPRQSGGYEYQAIAVGEDLAACRSAPILVTQDASLQVQRDMRDILLQAGLTE